MTSLPVRGAWIEICTSSPCKVGFSSLPVRGAWIEIRRIIWSRWEKSVRGAWIEIFLHKYHNNHKASLPVRGAWIEIHVMILLRLCAIVAPCEGSVD